MQQRISCKTYYSHRCHLSIPNHVPSLHTSFFTLVIISPALPLLISIPCWTSPFFCVSLFPLSYVTLISPQPLTSLLYRLTSDTASSNFHLSAKVPSAPILPAHILPNSNNHPSKTHPRLRSFPSLSWCTLFPSPLTEIPGSSSVITPSTLSHAIHVALSQQNHNQHQAHSSGKRKA